MTILVLEDDDMQMDVIERQLKKSFRDHKIRKVTSEYEFREQFESIAKESPHVFIIDVMLRWTRPREEMPERPDDVKAEGSNRAGFRCKEMLATDSRTRDKPVILYTVLEESDLAHDLNQRETADVYIQKRSDQQELISKVREYLDSLSRA